jgi:hypothetical protein
MTHSIIFFVAILIAALALFVFSLSKIFGNIKMESDINKHIKKIATEPNDQNVTEFINHLKSVKSLGNELSTWEKMRAAFDLVESSNNIAYSLKQDLRNIMLSLGVSRLKEIKQRQI